MAHRLAPGTEVELDEIWLWTAKESGRVDVADRLIDSITESFFLLARYPHMGRPRDDDLRLGLPVTGRLPVEFRALWGPARLEFPLASKCDAIRLHS
jgi:plasmid stabilization system protein ParE